MRTNFIKYLLVGIFLFLLWAPVIQEQLNIFHGGELRGAFVKPDNIAFSFTDWFNGNYAERKEAYIRTNFGFQGDLVRLHNQIDYSLFSIANAKDVVVGKNDYLYEQQYIDSYLGQDFAGDEKVIKKAAWIKELQDTLQNHGIFLFVVFAPGKGSFYPEYIPRNHWTEKKPRTNYEACVEAAQRQGLNLLDLKSYFSAMKDTSRYRLYPRRGMHWSYYGDVLAFDTMVNYVRQKTGFAMTGFKIDSIQLSKFPRSRDHDAEQALNLIVDYDLDTLAYPFFSAADTARNLNFLVEGDSYYWNMYMFNSPLIFRNCSFWYYFDKLYRSGLPTIESGEAHKRLKEILLRQNIICIMQTDPGLANLGSNFAEEAVAAFKAQK